LSARKKGRAVEKQMIKVTDCFLVVPSAKREEELRENLKAW